MFLRRIVLIVSLSLCLGAVRGAEVRDDPAPDLEGLTKQVDQLADTREKKRIDYLKSVRAQLVKAVQGSGTAGNFMIECMREVRFGGTKNENSQYSDWKKENRDLFSNRDFDHASDLHLKYLVLTLDRSTLESAESMAPKLWSYLDELDQAKDLYKFNDTPKRNTKLKVLNEKQEVTSEIVGDLSSLQQPGVQGRAGPGEIHQYVEEFMNTPVDSGFPGQALKLQGQLARMADWTMQPGDYSGILERSIRPYLREKKDPKLPWTWDREINYLREVAKAKPDPRELVKFDTETYPRLLWKKAKDVELIGMPNKALKMRIDIAKQYPAHQDFNSWTDEISEEIKELKDGESAEKAVVSEDPKGDPQYFGSKTDTTTPSPTPNSSMPVFKALQ